MHVAHVGSVKITALLDAPFLQDLAYLSPEHAPELAAEYRDSLNDRGLCTGAVSCYLIRTPDGLALIDSGIGPRKRKGFPAGHLDQALDRAGVRPADIDLVIHTHLHADHVGWNTHPTLHGETEIFFPNARFVIQRNEWDYWMTPAMIDDPRNAVLRECVVPIRDADQVLLVDEDAQFLGAIGFIATPGHTPGHVAIDVNDGAEHALIIGDSSHHPFQVAHSNWASPMDLDPELAIRNRDRLFDLAADDHRLVIGGHWEHPGWGRIIRVEDRRVYRPEPPAPGTSA